MLVLQLEIPLRVLDADPLDDGPEGLFVVGKLAVFDPGTKKLAEDAAEVLVP